MKKTESYMLDMVSDCLFDHLEYFHVPTNKEKNNNI